jgi:hypothetical protein
MTIKIDQINNIIYNDFVRHAPSSMLLKAVMRKKEKQ